MVVVDPDGSGFVGGRAVVDPDGSGFVGGEREASVVRPAVQRRTFDRSFCSCEPHLVLLP